jgi:hypothetical protein
VTPYNIVFAKNIMDKAVLEDKVQFKKEMDRKYAEEPRGFLFNTALSMFSNKLN